MRACVHECWLLLRAAGCSCAQSSLGEQAGCDRQIGGGAARQLKPAHEQERQQCRGSRRQRPSAARRQHQAARSLEAKAVVRELLFCDELQVHEGVGRQHTAACCICRRRERLRGRQSTEGLLIHAKCDVRRPCARLRSRLAGRGCGQIALRPRLIQGPAAASHALRGVHVERRCCSRRCKSRHQPHALPQHGCAVLLRACCCVLVQQQALCVAAARAGRVTGLAAVLMVSVRASTAKACALPECTQ